MDECANNGTACGRNASCINTSGSHSCKYQAGFTGDGMNCININECLANNTCDEHAACKDSQGSYSCSCKTGFAGNGTVCNDINECKNQSICCKFFTSNKCYFLLTIKSFSLLAFRSNQFAVNFSTI